MTTETIKHSILSLLNKVTLVFRTRFGKFCVVGIANTTLNYLTFYVCLVIFEIPYLPSGVLGFVVAFIPAFLLNRAWTFKSSSPLTMAALKYFGISAIVLGVHSITLWFVIEIVGIPAVFSQLFAIAVTTVLNFTLVRKVVFHRAD